MIRRAPALAAVLTLTALTLTGCGGGDEPKETASPSVSTASASPSPTKSATPTEAATSDPAPEPTNTASAAEAAPTQEPAGDDEVQQFFQTGGQCISDVWSSSMPHTDALQQKVIDYCAANQLGDWAHGVDPMDPKNYGGGQSETEEKSAATQDEEIAKCQALDINTATSGAIQYCYMEYGIDAHGAPAYDPGATPDVAGPSTP
ncbi:hypothetical protein [Kocuria tytonis]|uniref:Lipoprotein n=1 Tax=Kocuria tytonis TaxID=2054280 RepID=A0A495A9R7_9MICC|nr:hypothetical protein [Kocuria tytonis]RKQ36190.1 hypothetical protein C1C97_000445 [Kocuria tytonis]